jgi:NDP-sugar pyrophosphorylase family protein
VRLEGDAVLEFIEKPSSSERISNITSLPVWILSGDVWPHLQGLQPSPRGEYELPAVFNALIAGGKTVVAYRVSGRQDLTNANDFLELNRHYLRNQQPSVQIHSSVQVPASAKLVPPILIGENCRLGEDVTIGPEVYLEGNVGVKAGVELRNCVATRGAEIAESLSTGIKM